MQYLSIVFLLQGLEQGIFVFRCQVKDGKVEHDDAEIVARLKLLTQLADFFDKLRIRDLELLNLLDS